MMARMVLLIAVTAVVVLLAGCRAGQARAHNWGPTPIPAAGRVVWSGSYAENIQPIFDRNCVSCHGPDRAENGLELTSYADVMRGTRYGAVVVPGSPSTSTLISVVRGTADLSIRMPRGARRLSDAELQNLVLWIGAGASGD